MAVWEKTQDGEFLKTRTLVLVIYPHAGRNEWEARVYNTGRYSVLSSWPEPLGHVNDAKRACLSMARGVLREEREELERVEGK